MANPQDQQKLMGRIIAKAWSDGSFKKRLLDDPAAILKAEGVELPAGLKVRAVENTNELVHLVIPAPPAGAELSDEDLENVAGGWKCATCNTGR